MNSHIDNLNPTAVEFSFKVVIECTITTYNIITTVTDFTYILNSGQVTKGTFTEEQVPFCGYGPVFSERVFDASGVPVRSPSIFSSDTFSYTFEFTSPMQVGTWTYNLIMDNDPNDIQPMHAEKSITVTVLHDCEYTSFVDRDLNLMQVKISQGSDT
jgi:hypothetical protein